MKLLKLSTVSMAAFLALGMFSSCDSVKDAIKVNIPLQLVEVDFEIPPVDQGNATLAEFDVYLNVDSAIKKNSSFSIDNIRSVKVKELKITTSNGAGEDHFGVLSACSAKLKSTSNSSWTTIAELTSNPDAFASSLLIPAKDVELKGYFTGNTFSYELSGTTRRATTNTLNCKAIIKFDVEVGPK